MSEPGATASVSAEALLERHGTVFESVGVSACDRQKATCHPVRVLLAELAVLAALAALAGLAAMAVLAILADWPASEMPLGAAGGAPVARGRSAQSSGPLGAAAC